MFSRTIFLDLFIPVIWTQEPMGRRGHIERHQDKSMHLPVILFDPPSNIALHIVNGIAAYPYNLVFEPCCKVYKIVNKIVYIRSCAVADGNIQ